MWRRKDIKKVQTITLSRDGLSAYCEVADAPLAVVDLRTGQTLRRIRACRGLHDSPFDPVQLVESVQWLALECDGKLRFRISQLTFAVLDVAFAPGQVIIAEARGPVRGINVHSGGQVWRYDPPVGAHVLRLGYREQAPCCLAVEWDYLEHTPAKLLWLSTEDGSVLKAQPYGRWSSWAFARKGSIAVNEAGMVIDTLSGLTVAQITF